MRFVINAVVVYAWALLMSRLMGKREISQLTHMDWIAGIIIGNLAAATIYASEVPLGWGLASIGTMALLQIASSFLTLKSTKARRLLTGGPTVLVRDGQPLYDHMARERFNLDNLFALLREKQITRLSDVELATLEPTGELGLVKRKTPEPWTPPAPHPHRPSRP